MLLGECSTREECEEAYLTLKSSKIMNDLKKFKMKEQQQKCFKKSEFVLDWCWCEETLGK